MANKWIDVYHLNMFHKCRAFNPNFRLDLGCLNLIFNLGFQYYLTFLIIHPIYVHTTLCEALRILVNKFIL